MNQFIAPTAETVQDGSVRLINVMENFVPAKVIKQ